MKDLWHRFHDLGTEMIITKAGRWVILRGDRKMSSPDIDTLASLPLLYIITLSFSCNNLPTLSLIKILPNI